MGGLSPQPHPPGDYDVVVVGSGPGGLQTAYCLDRLGVRVATISADDEPGGMFRVWPIFQRLLSWSKPEAPAERGTRAYEWYDHNSLLAEEPDARSLVPQQMDRSFTVPSTPEMAAGMAAFAERTRLPVRYGCRWESTRREDDGRLVLETTDGAYLCRAAVFALGVTDPWRSPIPGIEDVPHYAETGDPRAYEGRTVLVIGKRNSGFEIADGLLPWARRILLVSPRPVKTEVLAAASVRVRYLQPLEDAALGGATLALDAALERIERTADGYRVRAQGTTVPGELELEADAALAATGFRTPVRDLPALGVRMVAQDRIPALTPFFESASAPGVFFAGNASQGAPGLRKRGNAASSPAVHGFRYNARVLAEHLAERLGAWERPRRRLAREQVVPFLADELARAPELWCQKGYLARVVSLDADGGADEGILPLEAFVDGEGGDAVAVTVELDDRGTIYPAAYLRRGGRLREVALDPDPRNAFDEPGYRDALERVLA